MSAFDMPHGSLPTLLGNHRHQQTSAKPEKKGSVPAKVSADALRAKDAKVHFGGEPHHVKVHSGGEPHHTSPHLTVPMSAAEKDFMAAIMLNDPQEAKELLKLHGASLLSGRGGCGVTKTAILYAAEAGNQVMCDLIVAHGGVEALQNGRDIHNQGPSDYAEKGGHQNLAIHLRTLESRKKETGRAVHSRNRAQERNMRL